MAGRKHLMAVNRAVRGAGLDDKGLEGPMIEVLRDLARKMDAAGPEGPSLNLVKSYLSATKDLARASARRPGQPAKREELDSTATSPSPSSPPALSIVEESPLDKLRRKKAAAG